MRNAPTYTSHSSRKMAAWLKANKLHMPTRSIEPDEDEDDDLTYRQRLQTAARHMVRCKEIRTEIDSHRKEAIKHLKAACPGIDADEINKFIAAVRRRGRAKVINIDKIRAKARVKLIGSNL